MSFTEQEQRIALCERLLGWKRHRVGATWGWQNAETNTVSAQLPDTNSLDVLHEIEMKLSQEQQESYTHELSQLIPQNLNCGPGLDDDIDIMCHREFDLLHANAAQRLEALCRVLFPERFKACTEQTSTAH